jgi:hypothetical protein
MKSLLSFMLASATVACADTPEAIQRITLDERVVVTVPVATNRVTTISFPGSIAAIDAAGVTADGKTPGQFQIAHTKGSSFLSVRALARKAATNLNVRWNKRTYVFELVESDAPLLALNLEDRAVTEAVPPAPLVTPTRLMALLDKAKAFPLLKMQHPEAVAQVEVRTFGDQPQVTDFNEYEIRIKEIFRFNPEDTLVFHVTLRNKSDQEIRYWAESFAVRVGNRVYHQSISDAPGVLPPRAASTVYFAITGTPDGGRNELSLKNDFNVLMSRLPYRPTSPTTTAITPPQPLSPSPRTGITPETEALARQALRRAIAELEQKEGRSGLSPSNSPGAKQTPADP